MARHVPTVVYGANGNVEPLQPVAERVHRPTGVTLLPADLAEPSGRITAADLQPSEAYRMLGARGHIVESTLGPVRVSGVEVHSPNHPGPITVPPEQYARFGLQAVLDAAEGKPASSTNRSRPASKPTTQELPMHTVSFEIEGLGTISADYQVVQISEPFLVLGRHQTAGGTAFMPAAVKDCYAIVDDVGFRLAATDIVFDFAEYRICLLRIVSSVPLDAEAV